MGVVYEAEQLSLARRVALKTMLFSSDSDDTLGKRFEHEARTAARLHHPRIVPVYDVGESKGLLYYAMQYIEGRGLDHVARSAAELLHSDRPPSDSFEDDLAQVLLTGSRLIGSQSGLSGSNNRSNPTATRETRRQTSSARKQSDPHRLSGGSSVATPTTHARYFRSIAKLGRQAADALAFAHEEGVIHRDIKPANLLLDINGDIWIADFGLVKTNDTNMTQTGAFVGTLRYMAPERFRGECTALSDVYSLGVTLYEMLAFRPAIDSSDKFSLISNIRDTDPPDLRKIERRIPRDLEVIVNRAIHKEPKRRYQSARDLAADLERFIEGRPILARSVGPIERSWIWSRRNPLTASLIALLVVGILATTVGSVVAAFQFREIATRERTSKEEERKTLARSNFFLSLSRWSEGRALEAIRLLDSIPDEYRDIEWYLAKRRYRGSFLSFHGHSGLVRCVAMAPDGQTLFSGGNNGEIFCWNIRSGKRIQRYGEDIDKRVISLALDSTGTRLAAGYSSGLTRVWTVSSGKLVLESKIGRDRIVVDFNREGKLAIGSAKDDHISVLDVDTGGVEADFSLTEEFRGLEFSLDGKQLYVLNGTVCEVWNIASTQLVRRFVGHSERLSCLSISPDGRRLLTGADDKSVILWDTRTGEAIRTIRNHGRPVEDIEFRPDGREFVTVGRDNTVRITDSETGEDRGMLGVHFNDVTSVAWTPDGRFVASAGLDGYVRLWDPSGDQKLELKGHGKRVLDVDCDSSGQLIASTGRDQSIRIWDAMRGSIKQIVDVSDYQYADCLVFTDDNRTLISGHDNGTVLLTDVATGHFVRSFPADSNAIKAVDTAGKSIATGSEEGLIATWDYETNEALWSVDINKEVNDLDFNHNGSRLATISNSAIQIWNAATGDKELSIEFDEDSKHSCVQFSPDSTSIVGSGYANTIAIWDARTGEQIQSFSGHQLHVNSAQFSLDGKRLLSCGSDNAVMLWDVSTGEELLTLEHHTDRANRVLFTRADKRIASCSHDGTIQILPIGETAERARILLGHEREHVQVAFNEDGSRLISRSQQESLIWDTQSGQRVLDEHVAAATEFTKKVATSNDGRWMAVPIDRVITLVDQSFFENPNEASFLTFKMEGAAHWHTQRALQAEEDADWFATIFHLRRWLELEPDSKLAADKLTEATANWAAAKSAED